MEYRLKLTALVVFLLGAAIRLAFLAWRGPELSPDSKGYLMLGRNLLAHGAFSENQIAPFNPSIRFPPLYPVFIAALSWSGEPSPLVIAAVQAIVGALIGAIVLLLAYHFLPFNWAAVAALAYVFHPGAISGASTVLTETVFGALLICAVWVLACGLRNTKLWLIGLSGLIFGLSILCRPVVLLLPLILFALMLMFLQFRRSCTNGVVLAAAAFLVVAPWSIRSSQIAGRLVAVQDTTVFAILFYVGTRSDWDQKNQATLWPALSEEIRRLVAEAEANRQSGPDEVDPVRIDRVLIREGIKNILANPGKYLALRARSFPYLLVTSFDSATGINQSFGTALAQGNLFGLAVKTLFLILFSLVPLLLGIVGLVASRKNMVAALCGAVWLYVLVLYVPLWVEPRYWTPFVPFLSVSAAYGASILWRRFSNRAKPA